MATPGAETPADLLDDATGPGPSPSPTSSPNQAPSAIADVAATAEDASVRVDVLANDQDPDGDELALASVDTPVNVRILVNRRPVARDDAMTVRSDDDGVPGMGPPAVGRGG